MVIILIQELVDGRWYAARECGQTFTTIEPALRSIINLRERFGRLGRVYRMFDTLSRKAYDF